jgi:hypothetical protein
LRHGILVRGRLVSKVKSETGRPGRHPGKIKGKAEMNNTSEHKVAKHQLDKFCKPVLGQIRKAVPSYQDHILDCPFPVWKTITVGGKSPIELYRDLVEIRHVHLEWAAGELMLGKPTSLQPDWKQCFPWMEKPHFTTLPQPKEISLVRASVYDLGFVEMPMPDELFDTERLCAFRIELCPAETAAQLLLQHPKEEYGFEPIITMEPLGTDSLIGSNIFMPLHTLEGELVLSTHPASTRLKDSIKWELNIELIFARRSG